jgi:cytochrome c oxidase assembly protein Cox11
MQFSSTVISADAESGKITLALEAPNAAGIAIATVTLQFRTTLNPSETVQAFKTRAESEARNALQAAASFNVTPHK